MTDLSPETVERMVALVRDMADGEQPNLSAYFTEARAIAAELPEPVDPDTLEAKKALAEAGWVSDDQCYSNALEACEIAIKRGRTLATSTTASDGRG